MQFILKMEQENKKVLQEFGCVACGGLSSEETCEQAEEA